MTYLRPTDEIIIQGDAGNVTDEVISVIYPFLKYDNIFYVEYPLNKDYATFKNNIIKFCSKEWILQVDADEIIPVDLVDFLYYAMENYNEADMFTIPRKNIVNGITPDYIKQYGWQMNEHGFINFPDYQQRFFKNNGKIRYVGKVHETLDGYDQYTVIPPMSDFSNCIEHIKDISRQVKQNKFYESFK
jgi:glycosyltransferase involved in cell wall biosynthesis